MLIEDARDRQETCSSAPPWVTIRIPRQFGVPSRSVLFSLSRIYRRDSIVRSQIPASDISTDVLEMVALFAEVAQSTAWRRRTCLCGNQRWYSPIIGCVSIDSSNRHQAFTWRVDRHTSFTAAPVNGWTCHARWISRQRLRWAKWNPRKFYHRPLQIRYVWNTKETKSARYYSALRCMLSRGFRVDYMRLT